MEPTTKLNTKKFVEVCLPLLKRSWDIIVEVHERTKNEDFKNSGDVAWKDATDPVTIADFQAQYVIYNGLKHYFPDLTIIGEENPEKMLKTEVDFTWGEKVNIDSKGE